MHTIRKKKDPLELADLVLKNDPGASAEQIAAVISEWGNLFDDQKFVFNESIGVEGATKGEPKPRN
jgi:hypothetical protein